MFKKLFSIFRGKKKISLLPYGINISIPLLEDGLTLEEKEDLAKQARQILHFDLDKKLEEHLINYAVSDMMKNGDQKAFDSVYGLIMGLKIRREELERLDFFLKEIEDSKTSKDLVNEVEKFKIINN